MTPRGHLGVLLFVLLACVVTNIVFFLLRPDYFGLFIAASFYLNMYYFITLLIPTNFQNTSLPAADLSRFHTWLKEIGVTGGTTQFTRLFINSLFMNSRALSLGIGLIFSIDIVFTLIHYTRGLPLKTTIIVITQCAVIVIFYLLVWKVEPFSTTYVKKVEEAKRTLHRRKLPPQLVTAMFLFGFLVAIFLFLTTIIYLPGVTLNAFLNQSQLTELGHLFSLLAVLAISQYFIIRYIHGNTSRTMADRLFDFKEQSLNPIKSVASLNSQTERNTQLNHKKHFGYSAKEYNRYNRFIKTIELLQNLASSTSKTDWFEIITQCGYYDQSQLIHDFKYYINLSPTNYLKFQQDICNPIS